MRLLFVGDIMLGRESAKFFPEDNLEAPWGSTAPILAQGDLVIGNLEMAVTDSTKKRRKKFNFALPTKYAPSLKPFHLLSLANNHVLDYQVAGLTETIATLDRLGVGHAGAGGNLEEAVRPCIVERAGQRIAFLSACDGPASWGAGKKKAGVWYIDIRGRKWKMARQVVETVKANCDLLIMALHWQANYVKRVERIYKEFGRYLIDAGVDIVCGTGPHHILPIEQYRQGLILYSLGDFVDDYAVDPAFRNDLGVIAEVVFDPSDGPLRLERTFETYINRRQVNVRPRTCSRIIKK